MSKPRPWCPQNSCVLHWRCFSHDPACSLPTSKPASLERLHIFRADPAFVHKPCKISNRICGVFPRGTDEWRLRLIHQQNKAPLCTLFSHLSPLRVGVSTRTSYLHSLRDMRTQPSPQLQPTGSGARPGRQQRPLKGWQRCHPLRMPQQPRRTGWTGSKSTLAGPAPTG